MSEKLRLSELMDTSFHTSETASEKNQSLVKILGTKRYGPARLALSLSLLDKRQLKAEIPDIKGKPIRGHALFGGEDSMSAWIALITQHAGRELDKQAFITAVAIHWERGINILHKMWKGADGDFDRFIIALAEKSGLPSESSGVSSAPVSASVSNVSSHGSIDLHIGKFESGDKRGETAQWRVNSSGHPPHIAVMGSSGGGKTRLALKFVEEICVQSKCATFIFDVKGDIAEDKKLCQKIGAKIIKCPETPVPLDILHVVDRTDNATVQNTAARFCHSLDCVTKGGMGDVQMDRLRQVVARIITRQDNVSISDLRAALIEHYQENNIKDDSVIAGLNYICDYNLFVRDHAPDDFFNNSWIFAMNNADEGIQRFTTLMVLDALNRYFVGLPEAEVDVEDNRRVKVLLVVDEAYKILGYKHPALGDIIRLSRSKGGVVILISQSPTDYMQEDVNFIENIGLTISYLTSATPAAIQKVFSEKVAVSNLKKGTCFARFSGQGQSVQKIKVWE